MTNRWGVFVGCAFYIVKNDTNNDGRFSTNDKLVLKLSTPEGKNYTEVIADVDDVLGYDLLNNETIALMFNRKNQGYSVYINLSDFTVTKEIALPKMGN